MKKKGFTLIELLAVIIILGILMLIAIPSVTNYINNSRKETYVDTAKELIKGAGNLVNSGELDIYNPNTTYYIPCYCIKLENGEAKSPYGKFDPAYVVVTLNNDNYNYYWLGRDTEGIGIETITPMDNMNAQSIKNKIEKENIKVSTAIGKTNSIKVLNESDCETFNDVAKENSLQFDSNGNPITARLMVQDRSYTGYMFGKEFDRDSVEKLYVVDHIDVPSDAIDSWDVSEEQNGEILAWYFDKDNNSKYELYIGQKGGVIANEYCWGLFDDFEYLTYIDVSKLNTSLTTNMVLLFSDVGSEADSVEIVGLNNWDTSNVTKMSEAFVYFGWESNSVKFDVSNWDVSSVDDMSGMFRDCGPDAEFWEIGDLSNWNTSKVEDMGEMFELAGCDASNWSVGDLSRWNTSNVTNMYYLFDCAGLHADVFDIGDLSNWDFSKVKRVDNMFRCAGEDAGEVHSIGTLNLYAENISCLFINSTKMKATVNIYVEPNYYDLAFRESSLYGNSNIVVNYSSSVTNIDNILATKSPNSHVSKGVLLD